MDTSTSPRDPRTVDIYINDRWYCTLTYCVISIDVLQQRLIEHALISDGKIMIVERGSDGKIMIVEPGNYNII